MSLSYWTDLSKDDQLFQSFELWKSFNYWSVKTRTRAGDITKKVKVYRFRYTFIVFE